MANLKSAIKRVRTNEASRQRNQKIKSFMRSRIKTVEAFVAANDEESAKEAYNEAVKVIDRAIQRGAVHKNNGNRNKARLAKKINNISA